ncbi:MAG: acyl-CoA dehydrogenase family protein [Deltaproteobacteria bacterium]|nr:acyl-CoA dehydrogenase family protein [Deltaproteobacteria bacterium]
MTRDSSFMKSLFHGVIADDLIFPYPSIPPEERENLTLMIDSVRKFMDTVDSKKIDREHRISDEVMSGARDLGLFGLNIPTEYGGLGLSQTSYARVMQEVAAKDNSLAVTLGAHQSIGLKGILMFGTEAQKKKYLPRLAAGEQLAAFALTEPGAGSDAAGITTRAELSADGEGYVLNGSKIWITNGGIADVFTVFARTSPQEEGSKPRITAFIVERGHGLKHGPNEEKLGIRGSSTTEIFFEDVKVPAGNVLGEVGRGFRVAMEVLNNGRLGIAAGATGACKSLLRMAVERCLERKAFGRNIADFGMIKDKIARMTIETYALESMTYLTTGLMDAGVTDYSLESAICKIFGSETLWRVVNETLQIAAGIGYMTEYPYERLLRDSRINLIFEGTNEILRAFVALSGMQGPGKNLTEIARAMREPIKGFGVLSDYTIQRVRTALGRERMTRMHPVLMKEAVAFSDFAGELGKASDKILRRHGKDVAEMQLAQKRLAELAIELYATAATISRTSAAIEQHGEVGAARQVDLCTAFVAQSASRMNRLVRQMDDNDDDLRKRIAGKTYEDLGYPFDVL